jgi:hypothetical protein
MPIALSHRVPLPTKAEMVASAQRPEFEIVACSGVRQSPLICMNVAFRTGNISTVSLDEMSARHLLAALKCLFPRAAEILAAPSIETEFEIAVQAGHLPD